MKFRILMPLFFALICTFVYAGNLQQKFDRQAFYKAVKSKQTEVIDNEIATINSSAVHQKEAYEGTLLMCKAGLVKLPAQKLKLFKEGRIKLETVIAKDSTVAEYRFMRLIIQENAPKIVKYKQQLQSDKAYIQKSFKSLPSSVQEAIEDYSKSSKILRPQDL